MKFNFYLIQYAINSLLRQKTKNLFIVIIFTFLTFLLTSVFLVTSSLKYELFSTLDSLPDITVQKIKAGKPYDIDESVVDDILQIDGVSKANARVWGYYYFANAGVNFSLIGLDEYEEQYKKSFEVITNNFNISDNSMIVGEGVKKILDKNYYKKYFNFIKPNGTLKKVNIAGVFKTNLNLEANDVIVLSKQSAKEIFDMPDDKATDIVVRVPNPKEIPTISQKIKLMHPECRVISKDDLKISYENIFNYKGGIFLAIFIVSLFTFFMIVYDKASGLNAVEKKEIGILKALGWTIDDVLKEKFYESFIVSFISYILGLILAFGFVYIFQAPILRDVFEGYSKLKPEFNLPFVFDFQTLALVFFLSVPIYIAATIIPSWRVATLEADEVIR